jgi:small-conductance mechanosensitive channel
MRVKLCISVDPAKITSAVIVRVIRSTYPLNKFRLTVIKIILLILAAIVGSVFAFFAGPHILGRNLTGWELGLIFLCLLVAAWIVLGFQHRLARRRELDARDSALW